MLVQRDNKVSKDELAREDNGYRPCVRSGLEENGEKVILKMAKSEKASSAFSNVRIIV